MLSARLVIDEAVGETRRALIDGDGRVFRLDVERWSEAPYRVRLGETWAGRLVERGRDGDWFVDLGPGGRGLLRNRPGAHHQEGQRLAMVVRSEPRRDKVARVDTLAETSARDLDVSSEGRLTGAFDPLSQGVDVSETIAADDARPIIDQALDEVLSACVDGEGGARLWIEVTRAATAIDVDGGSGGRRANAWAAFEAARQVSLRGVGGLLIIDFAGAPRGRMRDDLAETFQSRAAELTGGAIDCLGISRFGLLQAAIPHSVRPVRDAIDLAPPAEREALDGLRLIETVGRSDRKSPIAARLSRPAVAWLNANAGLWETALADRVGRRWSIEALDQETAKPDVWSCG